MRIGIITILKVNNYGAELQAYATQAVLKRLGYDAEIIDYLFYKNKGHKPSRKSKPVFPFSLPAKAKEWLYPKYMAWKSVFDKRTRRQREQRFEAFHKENTSMSLTYHSIDELYAAKMDYDVYLTGSDQVWNPGLYSSLDPYFLDFAPVGCKRIAYASSFGVSAIPEYAKEYYRKHLTGYAAIGVREKDAVDIVKEMTGRKAEWVLDPTLLLTRDEWLTVAKPYPIQGDYILIYELTPCPYVRQLAEHYHSTKGWQMVRICKSTNQEEKDGEIINITDAGPAEFLTLIANASLVITNSFHGTAFSINFNRDFYTVLPMRKRNNSRQQSLLRLFGLTERLLAEGSPIPDISSSAIDYKATNQRLSEERDKSVNFLKRAIDGE